MALAPPRLPPAVRALNAAGRWLDAGGLRPARLGEERLLAAARRATGLSDFGSDGFREPLRRLLHSLEHEAALSWLGRITARRDLQRLLEGRLQLAETWRRHPEILSGPIRAPIFVLGLPRTGTSILHELLALDPGTRTPLSWEVMRPCPPPERESYDSDPRIAATDAHLSGIDRLLPDFKRMHPMGARLPQECVAITAYEFTSLIFHTTYRVPGYQAWLEDADQRPAYRFHRQLLQTLQWRCPAERWVLKSPGHLWALDALLDVYPDARIVQCHRDPLRVAASLVSLVTTLRGLTSDRVDPVEIGTDWTRRLARGLEHTAELRQGLDASRVFDVHFAEFMEDEIEMVRRLYGHFGLELSREAEARMREFLSRNPRARHGAHSYRLEDTGLDVATERRRFASYQERYGVPSEI